MFPRVITETQKLFIFGGSVILGVNVKNIFFPKTISWLLGITTIAVLGGASSVLAQATDGVGNAHRAEQASNSNAEALITKDSTFSIIPAPESTFRLSTPAYNVATTQFVTQNVTSVKPETTSSVSLQSTAPSQTPVPGTVETSSSALTVKSPTEVAQGDIDIGGGGRRTSKYYVGIGANIGLGGRDSSLSDGNFLIYSKLGFTRTLSFRPSAVLGNDSVIMFPVTYDFDFSRPSDPFSEPLPIEPYLGVGAALKTGNDSQVAFLLTGGVDVPLTPQLTATAGINAGFFDSTDVGLLLGIAYNFGGF